MDSIDNASKLQTPIKSPKSDIKASSKVSSPVKTLCLPEQSSTKVAVADFGTTDVSPGVTVPGIAPPVDSVIETEFKPRYIRTGTFYMLL